MSEQDLNIFEGGLDERSKAYLLETTRWTKFLAILGFIALGFILLFAMMVLIGEGSFSGLFYTLGKIGTFMYFMILAVIYFFPAYFLMKFSNSMKAGINTNDTEAIAEGFRHQKNLFKYVGILSIILIALILIAIVFAGIFAAGLGR